MIGLRYYRWHTLVKIAVVAVILFCPQKTTAEWFGDLYLGFHATAADDLDIRFNGDVVQRYQDTDTGSVFGGRLGYWFEQTPFLGLAFDFSIYEFDFEDSVDQFDYDRLNISAAPFAALIMARLGFKKTRDHPHGTIQPYIGVGPSLFFSGMSEFVPNAAPTDSVLEDTSWGLGFDGRAGMTYFFWRTTGIFLEYRYARFTQTFERSNAYGTFSLDPTFSTNFVSLGVSFRF